MTLILSRASLDPRLASEAACAQLTLVPPTPACVGATHLHLAVEPATSCLGSGEPSFPAALADSRESGPSHRGAEFGGGQHR